MGPQKGSDTMAQAARQTLEDETTTTIDDVFGELIAEATFWITGDRSSMGYHDRPRWNVRAALTQLTLRGEDADPLDALTLDRKGVSKLMGADWLERIETLEAEAYAEREGF